MTKSGYTSSYVYVYDESITNEDYWDGIYDWMNNLEDYREAEKERKEYERLKAKFGG